MYDPELITRVNSIPRGISADLIATMEGFGQEELDVRLQLPPARPAGLEQRLLQPFHHSFTTAPLLILDKDEHIRPIPRWRHRPSCLPPLIPFIGWGFDEMVPLASISYSGTHPPPAYRRQFLRHRRRSAALVLVGSGEGEAQIETPRPHPSAATVNVDPTLMLTGGLSPQSTAISQA